jgi:hypothetical protein
VKIVERFERAGSAQVVEDPIPDSGNRVGSGRSGRINDAESTTVTSTLIVQSRPAEMEDWEATDDMEIADCAGSGSGKLQTVTLPVELQANWLVDCIYEENNGNSASKSGTFQAMGFTGV